MRHTAHFKGPKARSAHIFFLHCVIYHVPALEAGVDRSACGNSHIQGLADDVDRARGRALLNTHASRTLFVIGTWADLHSKVEKTVGTGGTTSMGAVLTHLDFLKKRGRKARPLRQLLLSRCRYHLRLWRQHMTDTQRPFTS